jgi:hypothetical protein
MATIISAVQNNSNMIAKLHNTILARFTKMDTSIDTLINKYQDLSSVTANAFDIEGLKDATSQIGKAVEAFDEIENSMKGALEQKKAFNEEASKASVREGPSILSRIGDSKIFQKGKDALVEWIKSTDQYAAMQERLKAMGAEWLSTDSGVKVTSAINNALNIMANVIERVAAIALTLASAIVENWSWIAPIVLGIVAALLAYNIVAGIHSFITQVQKDGLIKATAAQLGLNTAMLTCPIAWIIVAVIALIAIVYAVVAAINKFAGTSYSATGFIAGAFMGLGTIIYNVVASIWNFWASFVEFFANMFNDPVFSIKMLFVNLANSVLDLVKSIASAIDAVFGTNYSDKVTNLQNQMQNWLGEKPEGYKVIQRMEMKSIEGSAKVGYEWGKEISTKFDLKNLMQYNLPPVPQTGEDIPAVAQNTDRMADSVDMSNENLDYMRDLAEQEVVNRFATAEIKVDMTNHMAVNNDMDLDGVVAYLGEKLNQEMESVAEGVHI